MFNTVLVKALPVFEFVILIVHILAYISFEVVLLALGPHGNRHEVFEQWENAYEWSDLSAAVLIGIIAPVTRFVFARDYFQWTLC
jgi:hypothetical protein